MLVSADGVAHSARIASDDWSETPRLTDWAMYLRAQVMDEHGQILALSNPLFEAPLGPETEVNSRCYRWRARSPAGDVLALIKCPDCGRDVSTLAAACPGCGRPIATATNPSPTQPAAPPDPPGILRSNLGDLTVAAQPSRRSGFPVAAVLVVALVVVLVGAVVVLLQPTATPASPRPASVAATTAAVPAATVASSQRPAPVGAPLPAVNDISCDALESTIFHIHAHLALFVDGQEQVIPFGVGIGQPWEVSDSAEGPFVNNGSCFYWIHTHTEDGVLHIESPIRRSFTLGDFFGIWQQPLSPTQMGRRRAPSSPT